MFGHFVEEYRRALEQSRAPAHYRWVYAEFGDAMARWARCFR